MVRRSLAFPSTPRRPKTPSRRLQEAPKTPKRPPRSLQDPQDDPKSTPRGLMLEPRELQKTNKNMLFLAFFSRIQPLPFIFCSMLIRNGLKISSKSAPRCPKMPNGLQHGANMGPTWGPRKLQDRSKGGQFALPRGLPAQIALRPLTWTPHGPQMHPK